MVTLTRGGEVLVPNEAGDIVIAREAFWKVRCEVERVVKGPDLSELEGLTHAFDPLPGYSPRPLPRRLEESGSVLVFLIKPDKQGRVDLEDSWNAVTQGGYHHGNCRVVAAGQDVYSLLNATADTYYILDPPAGGWPSPEGPPLHALLECLLEGLAGAKTPTSSAAYLNLLALATPSQFYREYGGRPDDAQKSLREAVLWPGYDAFWVTRAAPVLRAWVDRQEDDNNALLGLSLMLARTPTPRREVAEELLARTLGLAKNGRAGAHANITGLGAALSVLEPNQREAFLLNLIDATIPDPHWVSIALTALKTCATGNSVTALLRVVGEDFESAPDQKLVTTGRRAIHRSAMQILARVLDDPAQDPGVKVGVEIEEDWAPGGRLADLLQYWRERTQDSAPSLSRGRAPAAEGMTSVVDNG